MPSSLLHNVLTGNFHLTSSLMKDFKDYDDCLSTFMEEIIYDGTDQDIETPEEFARLSQIPTVNNPTITFAQGRSH